MLKRILYISVSLLLVFSFGFTSFAVAEPDYSEYCSDEETCTYYEENSETVSEDESTSVTVTTRPALPDFTDNVAAPTWNAFQHVSVTFFISVNSLATVSYHAVAQQNGSIEATIYFEKLVLGSKWERVNIGTNGNKLTNRVNNTYISGTNTVKVSGEGTYRAVVTVKNQYGSASSSNTFVFSKSSSLGDANNDGYINAMDARLALRFSAGLQKYNSSQKTRCDVNGDDKLTAADARIILRISAKLM